MAASSKPIPTSTDAHNITSTTEATTSSRSSWKSRLMGGGSSSNNATTTSSRPRRSASPGLRRFSHASNCTSRSNSNVGDEKKDDHGDDAVLVASIEVTAEAAADIKAATMNPERTSRSLSASREQRSQKKGMRGRLRQLLPKSNNSNKDTNNRSRSRGSKQRSASPSVREHGEKKKMTGLRRLSLSNKLPPTQQPPPAAALPVAPVAGTATIPPLQLQNESPAASKKISPKSTKSKGRKLLSPKKDSAFSWQTRGDDDEGHDDDGDDAAELSEKEREELTQKQFIKERDGFCRRVDTYDGQVIGVDGAPTYELGNYLGGGVAGVVYEGHRLQPIEKYPVRSGFYDGMFGSQMQSLIGDDRTVAIVRPDDDQDKADPAGPFSFFCAPSSIDIIEKPERSMSSKGRSIKTDRTDLTGHSTTGTASMALRSDEETAIEALSPSDQESIIIDSIDAPSRSRHYARAIARGSALMEETVAIKILNPVGFRIMSPELSRAAVVVRKGEELEDAVKKGRRPMEERHVWWLVNPNSRNLRTLQRYKGDRNSDTRGPRVDRGSADKGLRISLVAAMMDPKLNELRELPLTRCIEIWGHIPFSATEHEFRDMMEAIDRVNAGLPAPHPDFFANMQRTFQRSTTDGSSDTNSLSIESKQGIPLTAQRTGLYRAVATNRRTVYCESLNAHIALPVVPSKYIRWLRQRRAATKEIRNMMLIGRHRNVVHLFEVLEHIQETKSTMFLILELVKGGELFDLISSNAARVVHSEKIPAGFDENETIMRKFFRELASGVSYCHSNGIAHRDLKPENLLVHNGPQGACTLKIADFGLSAAFGPQLQRENDQATVADSLPPPGMTGPGMAGLSLYQEGEQIAHRNSFTQGNTYSTGDDLPPSGPMERLFSSGAGAISFFTCGAVDDVLCSGGNDIPSYEDRPATPLKRMTSVVGSPHYVAPEIISQTDISSSSKRQQPGPGEVAPPVGYDGTKADVWSAGVILYAMLFRSLPFGEDLLRCPRYQSYRKWYDEARKQGGRRSSAAAALHPNITESDERHLLGPPWFFPSNSSIESRDLIVAMLNPDPESRPSIQLVMQHPWLLKEP